MKTRMTRALLLVAFLPLFGGIGSAQLAELYGGYTYLRLNSNSGGASNLNGWAAGAQVELPFLPSTLSVAADFGGTYGKQGGVALTQYTYLAGPRLKQEIWRGKIFEHVLVGNAQLSAKLGNLSDSSSSFATAFGGGIDLRLTGHIWVRPLQADYFITHHAHQFQNNFRYSSGLVWRF